MDVNQIIVAVTAAAASPAAIALVKRVMRYVQLRAAGSTTVTLTQLSNEKAFIEKLMDRVARLEGRIESLESERIVLHERLSAAEAECARLVTLLAARDEYILELKAAARKAA